VRWCLAVAAACYSPAHLAGTGTGDGGLDVPAMGTLCANRFGLTDTCASDVDGDVSVTMDVDTAQAPCDPQVLPVCLIHGTNVEFTQEMTASGNRPLVVIATGMISIDTGATVDASAAGPPATNASRCTATMATGAGGAAGGTYSALGGLGGLALAGSRGQPAPPVPTPTTLESGCSGDSTAGAMGGRGGGAVYFLAGIQIDIEGVLLVGGHGGGGASTGFGAGGGGAGGLIALDAPTIVAHAVIADGGGGGGGAATGEAGQNGGNGTLDGPAGFGAGTSDDNHGGVGAYFGAPGDGGSGVETGETGGGGGGGPGWVLCSTAPETGSQEFPTCLVGSSK